MLLYDYVWFSESTTERKNAKEYDFLMFSFTLVRNLYSSKLYNLYIEEEK